MLARLFVWLFVFAIPWQNMIILPGLGTASKLLGVPAVAATVLHAVLRGRLRPLTAFHWVAIAFFAWVSLSVFWGVAAQRSIVSDIKTYLQLLVMVWVIWEATPTRERILAIFQVYVLGAYVTAGSTILNFVQGAAHEGAYGRFAATGFDPNDAGMYMTLGLPMAWYIASTTTSRLQLWVNRAYIGVAIFAVLLTGSRGALLAALVALSVIPLTLSQLRRGVRVAAIVIMIGAGIAAVRFVPQTLFDRLGTTATELSAGTMNNRLRIWKAGLETVPRRPLLGYGPAGWYPAVGFQIGNRAPHSTWLAILVEEGIIGLMLYLGLYGTLLLRLLALPRGLDRRVALTTLATLAVVVSPLGWHQYKAAWLVLTVLAAWAHVGTPAGYGTALPRPHPAPPRRAARGGPPAVVK